MRRVLIAAAVLAQALATQVMSAQDSLAIRVSVGLVNVAFTARDAQGKLVANLTKDDVEVFDDGQPQTISFFAKTGDLPLALGLISDVSGSQSPFLKSHHHDLDSFLKSILTDRDQAFLIGFGNRVRLVSDFTSKREALMDDLKDFDGKDRRGPYPEIGPKERRVLGTAFYDALWLATTEKLLSAEHGKRALVVFSDGEDNSSAHHMIDAIEAAQSADVAVYGIRYTEIDKRGITARNKYGTSVMNRIARDTGGRDFDAREDNMRKAFKEIGEELRTSYELAYHSTKSDGTFHKLLVRAKTPGITIRAKSGYLAREGS
jgi:Ca-activated chloride channel family protein